MSPRIAPVCRILLLGLSLGQLTACTVVTASGTTDMLLDRQDGIGPKATLEKSVIELDSFDNRAAGNDPNSDDASDNANARYQLARSRVETATGTDLSHIALRIVSDALIDHEVRFETARLVDSQFAALSFRTHFLDAIMADQAGTYAALYSRNQSAILVSRTLLSSLLDSVPTYGKVRDATLMALLIHELVHAADDVRHDIQSQRILSFRASFAQSATFEGHAQWLTRQICAQHACLSGLQALDEFMFGRGEQLDHSLPAVQALSRNVLEYSYIEGERFIAAIAARPDGDELLEQLLDSPPQDPVQILSPMSFPDEEREARNQRLIEAARNARHPWTVSPWVVLESSPLKGINLRDRPSRRQAAIDGFTRLISAIVAVQLYDESTPGRPAKEATVIRATNAATARLFAQSLHNKTRGPEAMLSSKPLEDAGTLYTTRLMDPSPGAVMDTSNTPRWQTAIAVVGPHVVQISGLVDNDDTLGQYVTAVLAELVDKRTFSTSSR